MKPPISRSSRRAATAGRYLELAGAQAANTSPTAWNERCRPRLRSRPGTDGLRRSAGYPTREFRRAFTLVELRTAIAVIGVLAGLLLPALSAVKKRAHALRCESNTKQLCLALQMYAQDYEDRLPPNPARRNEALGAKWAEGWLGLPAPDCTNSTYLGLADILRPGPAELLTCLEERTETINDGSSAQQWAFEKPTPAQWVLRDKSGARHGKGVVLGFADGHVAGRRWQDARTREPERDDTPSPRNADILWLQQHATWRPFERPRQRTALAP